MLFNLGMTYLYASRDYEVAAHYLERSLKQSHPADSIVRKAFAMLVQARLALGELPAALHANEQGRRHYPEDAELLFQAGRLYGDLRRWDEARECLERLLAVREEPHFRSVDLGLRTYRGKHELAPLFRRAIRFSFRPARRPTASSHPVPAKAGTPQGEGAAGIPSRRGLPRIE